MAGLLGSRWLLAGGALVAAAAAAGVAWHFAGPRLAAPAPPDVDYKSHEPALEAAIRRARERVLKEPSAKAWGELGEVFIANDMDAESRVCFAQAERLDPGNPRWPYYQAGTLINAGDREAALPLLRRATELCEVKDEGNDAPRLLLAETLLALGRLDEAEKHFRSVLDRQPAAGEGGASVNNSGPLFVPGSDDPRAVFALRAHFGMGLLAARRQDWPASREHLLRCAHSPFAQKKAATQLAAVCLRLGNAQEAARYGRLADRLPRDRDWLDPYIAEYVRWAEKKKSIYRLSDDLSAAGQFLQAAQVLQPMTEKFPDDYLPQLELAKVLGHLHRYPEAEVAMRKALALAPEKLQCHYYLALVLYTEGEELLQQGREPARAEALLREAIDQARQSVALKSDYGYAHMVLGMALLLSKQQEEGLAELRKAVDCNPEFADLHFRLGKALAGAGKSTEARASLEQALHMLEDPEVPIPWRQEAEQLLAGLPKEAGKPPGRSR
jgi:tetratricopeptide (TPR) repeat protein